MAKEHLKEEILQVYQRSGESLFKFIHRMTGDPILSEDILQETFIRALKNRSQFRGDSKLLTWIYSIARNQCLQHLRKAKKNSFTHMEGLIEQGALYREEYPNADLEKRAYIEQVKEGCLLGLLKCLPLNQRIAFIIHTLYDVSLEDLSLILGKSKNATRILVHRGREKIKDFLCRNCSLYTQENPCRCENLISFSLKNGWIQKGTPEVDISKIELELKAFGNEVLLYQSLPMPKIKNPLWENLLRYIQNSEGDLFSKKVK